MRRLCQVLAPGPTPLGEELRSWLVEPGTLVRLFRDVFTWRCVAPVVGVLERAGLASRLSAADWAVMQYERVRAARRLGAIRRALELLGPACAAEGMRPVLLKGTSYHGLLYADPLDRPSSDVDVFLPCEDILRLHEVLLGLGFRAAPGTSEAIKAYPAYRRPAPWALELVYVSPAGDQTLEIKGDPITLGPPVRRLAEFAKPGPPSPCYPGFHLLGGDAMVIYQALHLSRRPQRDLLAHVELAGVLYARQSEIEPSRALDLVRGEGLYGVVREVLGDTDRLFPGVVPAGFLRREGRPAGFMSPLLRRGTLVRRPEQIPLRRLQTYMPHLICGSPPTSTILWLWSMLFPPNVVLSLLATPGVGKRHLRLPRRTVRWIRRLLSRST